MELSGLINYSYLKSSHAIISIIRIVLAVLICCLINVVCWGPGKCMTMVGLYSYGRSKAMEDMQNTDNSTEDHHEQVSEILSVTIRLLLLLFSMSCILAFVFFGIHALSMTSTYPLFNWRCTERLYLIVMHVLYVLASFVLIYFTVIYHFVYVDFADPKLGLVWLADLLYKPMRDQYIAATVFCVAQVVLYYVTRCHLHLIYSPGEVIRVGQATKLENV